MSAPVKTEGVDISPEAVERMCKYLERRTGFALEIDAAVTLRALRTALTASEKQREEAVRLLRAVGAGGIFTLMAESSDDADVWYDQRDAILKGQF